VAAYPTPGLETADGKPNLAAPTPETADGKRTSGLWEEYVDDQFRKQAFRPSPAKGGPPVAGSPTSAPGSPVVCRTTVTAGVLNAQKKTAKTIPVLSPDGPDAVPHTSPTEESSDPDVIDSVWERQHPADLPNRRAA
jgi:hypothetical protein